jgi:hypothetical protein
MMMMGLALHFAGIPFSLSKASAGANEERRGEVDSCPFDSNRQVQGGEKELSA